MSTATEIARLQAARNTIRNKLVNFGLAESTDLLDDLADAIDNIANQGAVSATVQEGDTYTIPAGYHNGTGTVSGVAGGGNYTLQAKTVTPTKSQQSITADSGYYGLSGVTVNAIPEAYQDVSSVNATAADVLSPKIIVTAAGVTTAGTMANNGAVSRTLDATTGNQSYTVPVGYHNGSGAVNIVLEQKSATPTTSSQTVTPTVGKVLSQVTVAAIPSQYKDTTNADAVAADVLDGKVVVTGSGDVTGTMTNNGGVAATLDATTDNQTYTVPEGYHDGTGTVSITLEQKSTTPTTSQQTITPTSGKVLSQVTVNAIPAKFGDTTDDDAVAANLLYGKKAHSSSSGSAVAITGSMPNNGAVSQTLDVRSGHTSYTVPAGYHDGTGTVSLVTETKSATPTTSSQDITPTSGKVLSKVTVAAIPSAYQDVTNVDATAGDVLSGKIIVAADGTEITGSMANNGAISGSIDGLTTTSYSVPTGYTSGGTVSLTSDIEDALAAI